MRASVLVARCAVAARCFMPMLIGALPPCVALAGCRPAVPQSVPAAAPPPAAPPPAADARVRPVLARDLPSLDGRHVKVTVLEVKYGPGGSSRSHSHPCAVIGHVVSGSLRSQVDGGPVETFVAGQSFYEAPNGVHRISANASTTEGVTLLVNFICDGNAPLSTPVTTPPS